MICRVGAVVLTTIFLLAPVASNAQSADIIIEKKTFEMPSYNTVAGATIKSVKIGWEAAGTLNADNSNAILITHYFSGTSHAFGKYAASDKAAGYWDAIIGPGKAIDTNKYYVLSSDTLVNLNAKMPNVVTTGPASINPDTGKQSRLRKSAQDDKWSFCLTAGTLCPTNSGETMSKRPRRNAHTGLQGEGGACCHQGRSNTGSACGAVRRSPQSDYIVEGAA